MEPIVTPRAAARLGATFRRFVRRNARASVTKLLDKTRPEDVATWIQDLTPSEQALVFRILIERYGETAGEVLASLDSAEQHGVLEVLEPHEIGALLETLPVDDTVAVVEELPEELREKVLDAVVQRDKEELQEHLTYGEDSAGRIMDAEFFSLRETATVGEAIATIQEGPAENIHYLYIVDADGRLVGVTSLRQLLVNAPAVKLADIMSRSLIKVDTETDQEDVARLAERYDLLAIPVTDDAGRLVGIVTVDDIIDVFKEEATEDFFKMVGTSDDEILYQDRSFKIAGIRLPWLMINLVGLGVAGLMIEHFQVNLKEALFLLLFVPVIAGMGGNIGSQTSTIAVRGLATGRIDLSRRRARSFLWQQAKVGAIIGLVCAVVAAAAAAIFARTMAGQWGFAPGQSVSLGAFAGIVGVSLFLAILVASVNGAFIPLVFEKIGIDPAVASGPLVTTSNDITGILIYFGLASLLIDKLVH